MEARAEARQKKTDAEADAHQERMLAFLEGLKTCLGIHLVQMANRHPII
jgi:hypothetical protein